MTPPWSGPSGQAFAQLVREHLAAVPGLHTDVRPLDREVSTPASFLVDISWAGGGVLCEVADSIDHVRVMDDEAEDVSTDTALRYIAARAAGTSKAAAWRQAGT